MKNYRLYLVRHGVTQGNLDGIYMGSGTDQVTELVQDAHFKQWMDPAQHYTPEGGEPAAEFHKRCSDVLMGMFEFMMKSNISEAACVTHGGVIMSMLAQRGMPRRAPELWMADSGCGYLLQCSPELWMRDGIVEVSDIIPFGYLDEEEGK